MNTNTQHRHDTLPISTTHDTNTLSAPITKYEIQHKHHRHWPRQATLRGNKLLEQNGGGGVQGLRQTSGKFRASAPAPVHYAADDESLSMEL